MLRVNGLDIKEAGLARHFPDGTQLLNVPELYKLCVCQTEPGPFNVFFDWAYENDEELVTLIYLSKHYREKNPDSPQYLSIKYCPNARMDRTKNDDEVFTLKYFCEAINSLGFKKVTVLDPHSNVTQALLDRVVVNSPRDVIFGVVEKLGLTEEDYVYFPDEGACKRYADLFPFKKNVLIGHKVRDWETGKIQGLRITGPNGEVWSPRHFEGRRVIMVDDIISYGGTLAYSADELKKLGFEHVYAYATHTENSVLDPENGTLLKRLEDGTVDRIYTTDSIYSGSHPKIVAFVA
jgi:ribose-phosphate pyrophosphokinase